MGRGSGRDGDARTTRPAPKLSPRTERGFETGSSGSARTAAGRSRPGRRRPEQRCDALRGRIGASDPDPGVERRSTPGEWLGTLRVPPMRRNVKRHPLIPAFFYKWQTSRSARGSSRPVWRSGTSKRAASTTWPERLASPSPVSRRARCDDLLDRRGGSSGRIRQVADGNPLAARAPAGRRGDFSARNCEQGEWNMALPDFFTHEFGTAVVWGESGSAASGAIPAVTKGLALDNLGIGAARMGASEDLGTTWQEEYYVQLIIETGTAPSAGTRVDLYLASSRDGNLWPAGVTGSDSAYTTTPISQLGWPVTSLIVTATGNSADPDASVVAATCSICSARRPQSDESNNARSWHGVKQSKPRHLNPRARRDL